MIIEVKLPELGERIEGADVAAVLVKPGDAVGRETGLVEVETDKAAIEVPAQAAGRVVEMLVKPGEHIRVGQVLARLEGEEGSARGEERVAAPAPAQQPAAGAPVPAAPPPVSGPFTAGPDDLGPPAAPFTRRLAREMGIDLRKVAGTGPGGRITPEDVAAFARRLMAGATVASVTPPLPDLSRWGEVVREPMSGIRRTTAENMAVSWTIPTVTQFDRADITEIEAARRRLNQAAEKGPRLTVTAYAVRAAARALLKFPKFNSSVDLPRGELVVKKYVAIGVAVDTPRGLVVPVIRDADRKGVADIAAELAELAEKARAKRIGIEELRGGTFSVSNLGGLGTTYFTPLINWPDVAVLGLGRAALEQVHTGSGFEPRLILPLSLSYDHRVIDGAEAARFLRDIAEALLKPPAEGK